VRVVLDTNVFMAGFGTRGLCEAVLSRCFEHHEIVISEPILAELDEHLQTKFKVPATRAVEIVHFLRTQATMVVPVAVPADTCRDADDLVILGTAVAGRVQFLVTGDKDLLVLRRYEKIPIVTPRDFYDRIRSSPSA